MSYEAKIGGARSGMRGFRLKLAAGSVQVDLLPSEPQSPPFARESDGLHTEDSLVECASHIRVRDRQDEMVDMVYLQKLIQ